MASTGREDMANDILFAWRNRDLRETWSHEKGKWLGQALRVTIGYGYGSRYFWIMGWIAFFTAIGEPASYAGERNLITLVRNSASGSASPCCYRSSTSAKSITRSICPTNVLDITFFLCGCRPDGIDSSVCHLPFCEVVGFVCRRETGSRVPSIAKREIPMQVGTKSARTTVELDEIMIPSQLDGNLNFP